jgi:hypothetical protein
MPLLVVAALPVEAQLRFNTTTQVRLLGLQT